MKKSSKKKLLVALGWGITALSILYLATTIELRSAFRELLKLHFHEIFILIGIYLFGFLIRGIRYSVLLGNIPFFPALGSVLLGYAANNVLPARLGELVRAQAVSSLCETRRTTALSTVVIERVFDGFAIVILLFVGCGGLDLPPWAEKARWLGLLLFGGALVVFLLASVNVTRLRTLLPENFMGHLASGVLDGISLAAQKPLRVFIVFVLSFFVWIIEGGMFLYAFYAFDFSIPVLAAYFVLGIVNLGILIPASPGYLGVFQYFTVLALGVYGVNEEQALAYAIVVHACQFVPVTLIGVLIAGKLGIRSFGKAANPLQ